MIQNLTDETQMLVSFEWIKDIFLNVFYINRLNYITYTFI